MIDEPDEPNIESTFSTAVMGASFGDTPLLPWTPARVVAAQSMGMLYPNVGDEAMEQFERTGLYAGALKDTIIFLWLCSEDAVEEFSKELGVMQQRALKASEIQRAERKPQEAWAQALAWADRKGLVDAASEAFEEGYKLYMQKMADQAARRVKPIIKSDTEGTSGPND